MWPNFDPLSDRLHGDDPASTYELVYPGGTRETWLDKAARDRAVDVDFLANYTPMADGQAPDKTRAEQLRRREVKALERLAAAAEKQANKQP